LGPSETGEVRQAYGWDRVRLSIAVPIAVIMAIAIVCVVVAVFGSAQRADEAALNNERQLFTRALVNRGERMLREIEAVAGTEAAYRRIRVNFDPDWVQTYLGSRLQSFFEHDFVFVADPSDRFLYALPGNRSVDPNWFNLAPPDAQSMLDLLRGRSGADADHAFALSSADEPANLDLHHRAARMQRFLGRPAIVAAVAVAEPWEAPADVQANAPIVLSMKFIDEGFLADFASRLQLRNLRKVDDADATAGDYVFDLADKQGRSIAKFAWTPGRPSAEIVNSFLSFIAIAIAGFALLAVMVFRRMRRTEAAVAAGETRLRHLALHDALCGLPNRIYFGERLEAKIDMVRNGGLPAAVLYIDLDHFKDVNDTLGHPIGDELIRNVTRRLTGALRGDDLVARIGGDEFAVITSAGCNHTALQTIADRLIVTLCTPYSINNHMVSIGASIGIAVVNEHTGDAADIMRHADLALYRAKNEGRSRACLYDNAMDAELLNRKLIENELREAISRDELWLAYQPIVNNSGETVVGVEALCRWTHPTRGEIPPSDFIPIAENSGLIIELGEWVLRRACLDANAWPGISLSVNVSPLQFRRSDFVDMVERILGQTDFDQTRLELEVTESTLLGNVDTAELAMFRLKALGVRLALDDFGTGYSSLLYLRRFPFDKLKIDRSFVNSIEKAADAAAIVHAVVSLGRGLGMKVTAEGVETAGQQLFLRAAGVHSMQGYRFGRPCRAADISARLAVPGNFRIADDVADLAMAV
jgi:diguanylate cyclase (GGDEF)-like protein